MITDLIDVEPVLDQHDPGMILVGPLLSRSLNSGYRYFYIAGNGSKVYETISLFVEVETNAQTQRADFIEKLKSRFAEVLTFGSHLEMAQAVHTRWPNWETAKFLAFAELEAKLKPTKVAGQQESIDDNGSHAGVTPGDYGKQLVDEAAPEPVDHAKDIDAISTYAPPLALDQAQPTLVPSNLPIAAPSQPLRDARAVTEQQRPSGLSQDDIASAILRLKSPAELASVPRLPVEGARSLASIMSPFSAVGCAVALVAALVAWAMLRPSTWQVTNEAVPAPVPAPSIAFGRNKDSSQAAAKVPPSSPNRLAEANAPAPQAKPAPATVPPSPPSQPSQVANVHAGAAPVSGPQTPPAPSTAGRLDAEEITTLVNRGTDSMKSGDLDPAQAVAAVPPTSSNPLAKVNAPTPQAKPAPVTVPPSPPSQPSQVASVHAGAAPVAGPQSLPAQGGSTARRLDAEEIATLVSRGTDLMKNGDLASARLLLRRAAESGSASAALTLGTTFDPLVIQQLGAIGIVPDVAQARQWYEKAAALGSDAASQRLAKLPQTGQ
jgi:hypothetical protein